MSLFVFTGPSLSAEEGRAEVDAVFLPPAAQGDVYRAALEKPWGIALIDGYFERVPAVWHKEILWAMSQGIHVFGAASMGALRAAELCAFGMEGVGEVFEGYRDGLLEDDDEVAVAHAAAEHGFRPLSEAMVNIRATLRAALDAGGASAATLASLEGLAKARFYPDRAWPLVLEEAAREGRPRGELDAFRAWLPEGRVNQKRLDALALLRQLRTLQEDRPAPKRVRYAFEHTDAWAAMAQRAGRMAEGTGAGASAAMQGVREELGVAGDFAGAREGVLARAVALELTRRMGREVPAEQLRETVEAFRRERGLYEPEDFNRWREAHHVDAPEAFFQAEARVRWVRMMLAPDVGRNLADHLRTTGELGPLLERARAKQEALLARGLETPELAQAGVTETELWRWYFGEQLGVAVPADLERYAREQGFAHLAELRRAVLREFLYARPGCRRRSGDLG